jgi:hypothetical protein
MANPTVTYTFVNGQTSDGPQVSQNFTDLISALTDGSKTITVSALSTTTTLSSGTQFLGPLGTPSAPAFSFTANPTYGLYFASSGLQFSIAGSLKATIDAGGITCNSVIVGSAANTISGLATVINGAGTLTLPTSTDTLVGKATTDIFTNKSMSGATNTFSAIPPSAITNQYWDGYTGGANARWTTTTNTYGDGTNTNGNAITQRQGSGITVTAGASNVAGITFTPASSAAIYEVSASFCSQNNGANANSYRLTDGSVVIKESQGFGTNTVRITICGIYVPGTASAVTVKIQVATGGGTLTIDDEAVSGLGGKTIEWTLRRIF